MTFLHPWLLGPGMAAIGLPVLIHYLTRPRPVRLPISTLRFIQEAVRQRRAVHRLRDLIILGLRSLAILLIAWAFARPLIGEKPLVSPGQSGPASRVVIVDASQSLAASVNGIQAFERARSAAARYLGYAPGLRANVILAGARPHAVFEGPSSNLAALREALAQARPRPERLDAGAALAAAAQMLVQTAGGEDARRELIIVSDFQHTNWGDVDFSALPEKTRIQLESVAPQETPPNLALLRVSGRGQAEQGGQITLEAEVGNYSPTPRHVQVEFSLAGAVYRAEGDCPAYSRTILSVPAVLRAGGWQAGEARLIDVEDVLPGDDVRPFVLNVRPGANYLLVTREPAGALASSSYYLERALVPVRSRDGQASEKVHRVSPDQLDREMLTRADLVVLDHPGKLPAEVVSLLAALMVRGKSLLYVAAEPVDASNLKVLAEAAGPMLKMPVEFQPATGGVLRNLRLAEVRADVPPFSLFGDGVSAAISSLRFTGGLVSRWLDGGLAEEVLAGYSNQSAALVVTACGSGALGVLNADLPASNLVRSPVFVPLVGELAGRLLGQREAADAVYCGEPLVVDLPAEAGSSAGLRVMPPGPADAPGELVDETGGLTWRVASAGGPGVYRVNRGDTTCFAMATAIAPQESDLRTIDPARFELAASGGRQVHYRGRADDDEPRDTLWVWLAAGCAACMLLELIALKALKT
ncbi:MAG TPA: BatA and WFA domain-containing protein [Phycisphaerae bacterium]|nr:BatA and WFA domain-containing protein [Phycisphaerae bacterium]